MITSRNTYSVLSISKDNRYFLIRYRHIRQILTQLGLKETVYCLKYQIKILTNTLKKYT